MESAHTRLRRPGMAAVRAVWRRLLDGAHLWGSFDATVGRYGLRRYRLIIFPPGSTTTDRRLLRLCRGWPVGGGVLALFAVMLVGGSPDSLLVAAAAYLTVGAVLFVLTAGVRGGVRSMSLILLTEQLGPDDRRRYAEWEALVSLLTYADHMLSAAAITLLQHEALWWQAYDRLEVGAHV
jgi:hypothetical protein